MTIATRSSVVDAVTAVDTTFGTVFEQIDSWRAAIERHVGARHGAVTVADIDEVVEALVVPGLGAANALIIGAGFVASPGFISDAEWHLAWWLGHANTFGVGSADPALRRLEAEEDPSSESFRDYTTLEWWRVPAATGAPHITGPYVDYLCTDDYTLTLTVPVMYEGPHDRRRRRRPLRQRHRANAAAARARDRLDRHSRQRVAAGRRIDRPAPTDGCDTATG